MYKRGTMLCARSARSLRLMIAAASIAGASALTPAASAEPPLVAAATRVDAKPIKEAMAQLAVEVQRLGGTLGAQVIDVQSGEVLAAFGEHRPQNPASNAKLVTAAAALRVLGGHYRFHTGLYGKIDGEVVDELVLRGDGDPSLRTADLWQMAVELRAAGVRRVRALAVDQSFFDEQYVPPAFEQQPHEWAAFRAPVAAVSLDENTLLFTVRPTRDGAAATVDVQPPGFADVTGSIVTARKGEPEKVLVGLEPRGARIAVRLGGKVPEGGRVVRVGRRVDDPRLLAGYALRAVLKQAGVEVTAEPKLGGAREKSLLVGHRSASVTDLLGALGKDSDNFQAEMLFRAIGAKAKGRPSSPAAASEAVRAAIESIGAFEPGMVVKNGSGLFDANRATAAATTALLRAMARGAVSAPEFLAHLSVGGVDGTLRHRFRSSADVHAVRAKTGTLDAVAALSGYVVGPPGRGALAFSILVNSISGKVGAARGSMDRVVEAAVQELWKGAVR